MITGSLPSLACAAEIAGPSAVRTASTICSGSFVTRDRSRDHFEDAHEVADPDAFVEQHLQHALDLAGRDVGAVQLVDDDRIALLQDVDEHLHVLAAEQAARVAAHDFGEVGRDHRRAVDDGRARDLGLVAELLRHPRRGQAEDGLARLHAGERRRVVAEHEHVTGRRLAAPDLHAVHADRVRVRGSSRLSRVRTSGMTTPSSSASLRRSERHAVEEVAALARVDEVDEVVRDLELERLDAHLVREVLGRVGVRAGAARARLGSAAAAASAISSSLGSRVARSSSAPPTKRNGTFGKPGTIATAHIAPPASWSVRLCRVNWWSRSVPRSLSVAARVTIRPDDSEINSAGICATSPSPTVRRLYVWIASLNDMCCCRTPTAKPPMRLIATMTMAAIASPFTNFDAPSIAP